MKKRMYLKGSFFHCASFVFFPAMFQVMLGSRETKIRLISDGQKRTSTKIIAIQYCKWILKVSTGWYQNAQEGHINLTSSNRVGAIRP